VRCAHDQSPYEQRRSSSSGTRYSEAVSSTHQRLPGRTGPSLSAASDTRPQLDVDRRRHSSRARPVPTSPAAAGRLRVTRQSAARRRRRWHRSRPRLLRRLQSVVQVSYVPCDIMSPIGLLERRSALERGSRSDRDRKKLHTTLLSATSPNVNLFSNFFSLLNAIVNL